MLRLIRGDRTARRRPVLKRGTHVSEEQFGEEFDLDDEDHAILDAIWDRIGAEKAAKAEERAAKAAARAAKKRQDRADKKAQ
jgi:hypothetical protein